MKKWKNASDCNTCMAASHVGFKCSSWAKECGAGHKLCSLSPCGTNYYANKEQTEALLNWHNKKYGTIQDRLARESDGETMIFGYVDGEWKEIEEMGDCDFRVGDKVTIVRIIEGTVTNAMLERHADFINVATSPGKHTVFYPSDMGKYDRELHHGHNLKVTVEEKKPVRTVERWGFLYTDKNGMVRSNFGHFSRIDCLAVIDNYETDLKDYPVLSGPIKVQIPK